MTGKKANPGTGRHSARGRNRVGSQGRKVNEGATRNSIAVASPGKYSSWLNRLIILLGAGAVVALGLQAFLTLQSIPVQRVSVSGELEHTQAEAVRAIVRPALADGFLGADLQRIRHRLEELPWIFRATVRRKWPSALEIHVMEQLPIARWGENGFLNHEGEVFRSSNNRDGQALPLLEGPDGAAKSLMTRYQRVAEFLSPLQLTVTQLVVDERDQIEVVLSDGMRLVLGNAEFLQRMQRFVALYREELSKKAGQVKRVDLRYENGIAVAFGESSQVAGI